MILYKNFKNKQKNLTFLKSLGLHTFNSLLAKSKDDLEYTFSRSV